MLGKNEGYCNCVKMKKNGNGRFYKVKTDDEGWCIHCGHYAVQGTIDQRGICKRGKRNLKPISASKVGNDYFNHCWDKVWNRKWRS